MIETAPNPAQGVYEAAALLPQFQDMSRPPQPEPQRMRRPEEVAYSVAQPVHFGVEDGRVLTGFEYSASGYSPEPTYLEYLPEANHEGREVVITTEGGGQFLVAGNALFDLKASQETGKLQAYELEDNENLPDAIGAPWKLFAYDVDGGKLQDSLRDDPVSSVVVRAGWTPLAELDGYSEERDSEDPFARADKAVLDVMRQDEAFGISQETMQALGYGPKKAALAKALHEVRGTVTEDDVENFLTSEYADHDQSDLGTIFNAYEKNYFESQPTTLMNRVKLPSNTGEKLKTNLTKSKQAFNRALTRSKAWLSEANEKRQDVQEKTLRKLELGAFATALQSEITSLGDQIGEADTDFKDSGDKQFNEKLAHEARQHAKVIRGVGRAARFAWQDRRALADQQDAQLQNPFL